MTLSELSIGQRVSVRQHQGTVIRLCVCMVRVRFDKSGQTRKVRPSSLQVLTHATPIED